MRSLDRGRRRPRRRRRCASRLGHRTTLRPATALALEDGSLALFGRRVDDGARTISARLRPTARPTCAGTRPPGRARAGQPRAAARGGSSTPCGTDHTALALVARGRQRCPSRGSRSTTRRPPPSRRSGERARPDGDDHARRLRHAGPGRPDRRAHATPSTPTGTARWTSRRRDADAHPHRHRAARPPRPCARRTRSARVSEPASAAYPWATAPRPAAAPAGPAAGEHVPADAQLGAHARRRRSSPRCPGRWSQLRCSRIAGVAVRCSPPSQVGGAGVRPAAPARRRPRRGDASA